MLGQTDQPLQSRQDGARLTWRGRGASPQHTELRVRRAAEAAAGITPASPLAWQLMLFHSPISPPTGSWKQSLLFQRVNGFVA